MDDAVRAVVKEFMVVADHDHHNTGLVWIDSSVYQARRAPSTELVESCDEVRW